MVSDSWLSNKVMSSDTDHTPIKLDLQIKEFITISCFKLKTKFQNKEEIPYWIGVFEIN